SGLINQAAVRGAVCYCVLIKQRSAYAAGGAKEAPRRGVTAPPRDLSQGSTRSHGSSVIVGSLLLTAQRASTPLSPQGLCAVVPAHPSQMPVLFSRLPGGSTPLATLACSTQVSIQSQRPGTPPRARAALSAASPQSCDESQPAR